MDTETKYRWFARNSFCISSSNS